MKPKAPFNEIVKHELRFLLDPGMAKNLPASSAAAYAYESWKNYMLMPNGQIRPTATPRIYRTAPNGNLTDFTRIAYAVHQKLAGHELPGAGIKLKNIPRNIAAVISRTLVTDVDAVVQMLPQSSAATLIAWFNDKYYGDFIPKCQQVHETLYRTGAAQEELLQWRSRSGSPLLLKLFHHTTDLMLGYKRVWYPKAGLQTELDTFENFTTSAAAQIKPNFPHVPWLWPDESGQYRTHEMYLGTKSAKRLQ